MRESIRSVVPVFNTHRMVMEYVNNLYAPAANAHRELAEKNGAKAVELSKWKAAIRNDWSQIQVSEVEISSADRLNVLVGEKLPVSARVHLGSVNPMHVRVQAYYGETDNGSIHRPATVDLTDCEKAGDGCYLYRGAIPAPESGTYGFNIRVVPTHPNLIQNHELRLVTWA
jgi:starch phosphorylase